MVANNMFRLSRVSQKPHVQVKLSKFKESRDLMQLLAGCLPWFLFLFRFSLISLLPLALSLSLTLSLTHSLTHGLTD